MWDSYEVIQDQIRNLSSLGSKNTSVPRIRVRGKTACRSVHLAKIDARTQIEVGVSGHYGKHGNIDGPDVNYWVSERSLPVPQTHAILTNGTMNVAGTYSDEDLEHLSGVKHHGAQSAEGNVAIEGMRILLATYDLNEGAELSPLRFHFPVQRPQTV